MTPALETVLALTATVIAVSAVLVTWAVWRTGRDPSGWTTAANHLAQRLTDHENRLTAIERTRTARQPRNASTGLTGPLTGKEPS